MASSTAIALLTTVILIMLTSLSWLILQRLFLHALANIPGPRLAALTYWYEFYYDVVKPGQYVFKIKDLHVRYGTIIRITPGEVHVNDLAFLEEIYPASNARKREKAVFQLQNLNLPFSTAGARDHELHRRRREALNPFFSQKSVLALEPMIKKKVMHLSAHLDAAAEDSQRAAVNLSDLYYALSRDIVFQYSFDKDSNYLGSIEDAAVMRRNLTQMLFSVKLRANVPSVFRILERLPMFISRRFTPPGARNMMDLRRSIGAEIDQIMAEKAQGKSAHKRSILHDIKDHEELQRSEELPARLGQEGTFLVMAATESTAKTTGITHFHLLRNPAMLSRLRDELEPLGNDPSIVQLTRLPYLNAVIQEGNRLSFGLTGRVARVAPDETLQYRNWAIPAGTPMSMTTLCIHTNETIFPDPWEFRPERWLGDEGKQRLKYHYGFGRGARRCLGMNLANAELLVYLSTVTQYDMELFETGLEDVEFRHDYQVAHPRLDSKGIRAVVSDKRCANLP